MSNEKHPIKLITRKHKIIMFVSGALGIVLAAYALYKKKGYLHKMEIIALAIATLTGVALMVMVVWWCNRPGRKG